MPLRPAELPRAFRVLLKATLPLDAAALLGAAYMLHEAQWVRRVDRRLTAPGVAAELDGLVVAHLSDFHAGFRPSLNLRATRKAVDLALEACPDLVVLTGDFAGGPYGYAALCVQLRRLVAAAPLGVYAVLGNHDHGHSKAPFVRATDSRLFADCGVRLLVNETVTVRRGEAFIQVAGIDDTEGDHDDLPAVLSRLDRRPGVLRLLLTHHGQAVLGTEPGDFHQTFAGDTHGGQICLPLPGRRIMLSDPWARFAEGAYDPGGRPLYVTRGVGTSLLPFRAFCRPEIVVSRVEAGG
jgi:uncharacterized protein